jgi:hypothetical protein
LKKILIASTVALFVGGWWFGAGGTYGSGEEALEKAKDWEAKGKTWKTYKNEDNQKLSRWITKMEDYGNKKFVETFGKSDEEAEEAFPYVYEYDIGRCQEMLLIDCYAFISGIPKTNRVEVVESTRKCTPNLRRGKDFQMTCKERPYKAKDWKGAKYVYFKVK